MDILGVTWCISSVTSRNNLAYFLTKLHRLSLGGVAKNLNGRPTQKNIILEKRRPKVSTDI